MNAVIGVIQKEKGDPMLRWKSGQSEVKEYVCHIELVPFKPGMNAPFVGLGFGNEAAFDWLKPLKDLEKPIKTLEKSIKNLEKHVAWCYLGNRALVFKD